MFKKVSHIDHTTSLDVSTLNLTEDMINKIRNPVIRAAIRASVEANTPRECLYIHSSHRVLVISATRRQKLRMILN